MKKHLVLGLCLLFVSLPAFSQGFYFDIGLGIGKGWTELNGTDVFDALEAEVASIAAGAKLDELAVDFGVKAGYGPIGGMPFYVVGELAGMGHRIYDSSAYLQFNSYIIGPGVIFYPLPLIQLGLSIGYSWVSNQTDLPWVRYMYDSDSGFAWNVSAAVDVGKSNHGFLIGIKYFYAKNTLEITGAEQKESMVGLFIKYAYRHKRQPLY
jgi:hypothetical protein